MNIPLQVVSFLSSRGLTLATTESCTAGQIASYLASVPGSAVCLDVGFITYSPSGKAGFLGVQRATMEQHGLTSEAVAREMAGGALRHEGCCADIVVSNTGLADGTPNSIPPQAHSASRSRSARVKPPSLPSARLACFRASATTFALLRRYTRFPALSITSISFRTSCASCRTGRRVIDHRTTSARHFLYSG